MFYVISGEKKDNKNVFINRNAVYVWCFFDVVCGHSFVANAIGGGWFYCVYIKVGKEYPKCTTGLSHHGCKVSTELTQALVVIGPLIKNKDM